MRLAALLSGCAHWRMGINQIQLRREEPIWEGGIDVPIHVTNLMNISLNLFLGPPGPERMWRRILAEAASIHPLS